ncbi:hypothetical protein [Hydrogenophaga sp. PAMC20947]|uniref:hypothetical protein n=1 Tax=Hydrogenophaga sp. PAMC20947 TaxID=2565558 RepID=UPI00109DECCA|nr:hypothetical protein [Hydrogenophaga sp. PAMC20947]QCB47155.1 hypothetical protein E5678_14665 [Hydrogenophaga sp. PAMC20947]
MSFSPFPPLSPAANRPADAMPLTPTERRLCIGGWIAMVAWMAAVLLGPMVLAQLTWSPELHGHPFADTRVRWGIPHAFDVLSNVPLLLVGAWGLWEMEIRRTQPPHPSTQLALLVFFGGLVFTSFGSAVYHWAPDELRLALDRLGMAIVFAGALGLAMAERVGAQTARNTVMAVLVLASLSAAMSYTHANPLPWVVVQFGGMAFLAWAASRRPLPTAMGISIGSLIALYALAKVLELGDHFIFEATGQAIGGHTLKHLAAAMAAIPVLRALRQNAHTATTSAGQ